MWELRLGPSAEGAEEEGGVQAAVVAREWTTRFVEWYTARGWVERADRR